MAETIKISAEKAHEAPGSPLINPGDNLGLVHRIVGLSLKGGYGDNAAVRGLSTTVGLHRDIGYPLEFSDMTQQAYFGLERATKLYSSNRGVAFSTFAYWKIANAAQRLNSFGSSSLPIRYPEGVIAGMMSGELGTPIFRSFDQDKSDVDGYVSGSEEVEELEWTLGAENIGRVSLLEMEDPRHEAPPDDAKDLVKEIIASATLSERDRVILELRFGLNGVGPMTLEGVGNEVGLTREGIRKVEAKAMVELRRSAKKLGVVREDLF